MQEAGFRPLRPAPCALIYDGQRSMTTRVSV